MKIRWSQVCTLLIAALPVGVSALLRDGQKLSGDCEFSMDGTRVRISVNAEELQGTKGRGAVTFVDFHNNSFEASVTAVNVDHSVAEVTATIVRASNAKLIGRTFYLKAIDGGNPKRKNDRVWLGLSATSSILPGGKIGTQMKGPYPLVSGDLTIQ